MVIETAIATISTNILTQILKTKKPDIQTEEERKRRKRWLRFFTAIISVISIAGTYLLVGGDLPVGTLEANIETITAAVMTFIGSQGSYFLARERRVEEGGK